MKRLTLGTVGILLAGPPAAAQVSFDNWFPPPFEVFQTFQRFHPDLNPVLQDLKKQAPPAAPVRWVVPKLTPLTAPEHARLSFTPSPQRRAANLNAMIGRWQASNPAAANDFRQAMRQTDLFKDMATELQKYGLRVDNVADAYAVYWISAWEAVNGVYTEGSKKQAQSVKVQVARAMLASGALNKATDAQKQQLAEELLIQAVLISAANETVQGDLDGQIALAEGVDANARQLGLDLTRMRLTEDGFAFPQ